MRFVPSAIEATSICRSSDGHLYSERFGDVYASASGAWEQAHHVFLGGTEFPARCGDSLSHTIIETGFGTGTNFLAAWAAWRASTRTNARLHYVAVEKFPFSAESLRDIHRCVAMDNDLSAALVDAYPPLIPGFHRLHLDGGRLTLTLLFGDAVEQLSQLDARADTFFLDGFSPSRNPDMWSDQLFIQLARLAAEGARAATYTVAGQVRSALESAGFSVTKQAGFGNKREMLVAQFRAARQSLARPKEVAIIGGGLAGTSCAARLAERGVSVRLFERQGSVGREASGNPAGILRPHMAVDWIPQVQLSVASFLYSSRVLGALSAAGSCPDTAGLDGVVHIAGNPVRNEKIARTLTHAGIPAIVVREISAPEAKELSGTEVAAGGWFYERGGWVDPGALCAVQSSGPEIVRTLGRSVETIQRGDHGWRLLDLQGHLLAETEQVLVCNAHDALRFEQSRHLPIRAVRGQLTYMEEKPGLLRTVCGDGYVTPARGGMHCVGATYNEGLVEPALRDEDHADNLRRLRRILPDVFPPESSAPSGGRVSFRTMSVDLLPVCGELAPGLHALLALGSRGISLAPLLAELLASDLCDEPSPLPRSLTEAMHPRRFAAVG